MLSRRALTLSLLVLIIVVLASVLYRNADTSRAIERCKSAPSALVSKCYTDLINTTLASHGLGEAFNIVGDAAKADPNFQTFCHSNMHDLGKAAYDIYAKDRGLVFPKDLSYCNFGFFHGFIEAMYATTGSVDETRAFCDSLGKDIQDPEWAVSNCYHGIGHGTTDGSDPRAWGNAAAMVAPGLAICKQIAPVGSELERSCEMGAFNSLELMYPDPKYKLDFGDDPYQLCKKSYDANEKKACYLEMSVLAETWTDNNYVKALVYASKAELTYRAYAVRTLMLFGMTNAPDPVQAEKSCATEFNTYEDDCLIGIVQGLMVYGTPGNIYKTSIDLCQSPSLPETKRGLCIDTIVNSNTSTAAEKLAVCKRLPESMRANHCVI